MKASLAAHAAARRVTDKAATAAARAAGQAVATAHAADHSMGALLYALKALEASGHAFGPELESQLAKLPPHLLAPVSSGIDARLNRLGIGRLAFGRQPACAKAFSFVPRSRDYGRDPPTPRLRRGKQAGAAGMTTAIAGISVFISGEPVDTWFRK